MNDDNKLFFSQRLIQICLFILAVISLFPIIASNMYNALIFSVMAGTASFMGHFIFATIFSSSLASQIYMQLYRPINAIVGIGFIIYGMKLFLNIL